MADIIVDFTAPDTLHLTLQDDGVVLDTLDQRIIHNADDLLLTGVDKLLQRNNIDKSALKLARSGEGIDRNSSLYRIVQSFASAIAAAQKGHI